MTRPQCVVIAGPNGAGKTSAAPELLKDTVGVAAFVNADVIAEGLAGFRPEGVSVEAGRIMLRRLRFLVDSGENFAFETTFSGQSVRRLMDRAAARGYDVHVFYLWLPSPDLAIARVKRRVKLGGHDVAGDVVRRRFWRSLRNAKRLWTGGVTTWRLYDATEADTPRLIASGTEGGAPTVADEQLWRTVADLGGGTE
jgi:predicted ABC-type ATPase